MTPNAVKPNLKLVGLHIEDFRALRKVDWPEDGLGWGETVPDMVMVGGVNGSGKTTLLELIAEAVQSVFSRNYIKRLTLPQSTSVTFDLTNSKEEHIQFRLTPSAENAQLESLKKLTASELDDIYETFEQLKQEQLNKIRSTIEDSSAFANSDIPGVVYLPSDRRLAIPAETYKAAGKLAPHETFFYRFAQAEQWRDSLEAILYSARWADLNAKEEGHPERATHFQSYNEAFRAFFGDAKQLTWENGELFVKINDTGALHPLMHLSSGEKQALIMAAELYRRWRPGSLILIDEPELHFHSSWQTILYTMLERWQKERGGQVIIATQSTHLFRIANPATAVLLRGPLA